MKKRAFLSLSLCSTTLLLVSIQAEVATARLSASHAPLASVDGLRLQGEIIKSTLTREDPPDYTYVLDLKLAFVNTGTRPIILLAGTYGGKWFCSGYRLYRSKEGKGRGNFLFWNSAMPAVNPYPKKLKETLDVKSPPQGATIIILPGESYTFYGSAVAVVPTDIVTPDAVLWVDVTYQMWRPGLDNGSEEPRFGKKLRERWEKYGYLALDPVTSDPIMFELKKWASK